MSFELYKDLFLVGCFVFMCMALIIVTFKFSRCEACGEQDCICKHS